MKNLCTIICTLFLSVFPIFSQLENNYVPQVCHGEIPLDFTSLIDDQYKKQITDKIDGTETNFEKNKKDDFVVASNSFLQQVLGSGRVLFGDPITIYLNKIVDEILKDKPELRKKIRVYTLKSATANALSTDQGIIFVTTGLLSQFSTEAQLAFVLCHEITHVLEEHSIEAYVENQKIIYSKEKYRHNTYAGALKAMSNYSIDNEYKADLGGLNLYLATNYDPKYIAETFDVLTYSYLPFEEERFDFALLENSHYKIPEIWKLDTINEISPLIEASAFSTHPETERRGERVNDAIPQDASHSGKAFIVSEDEFFKIRELSRFETIKLNLITGNLHRAIYQSSILLKKYPANAFLHIAMAKAFYGLYKYKLYIKNSKPVTSNVVKVFEEKSTNELDELEKAVFGDPYMTQGNEHRVVHLLYQMSTEQLGVMSLKFFLNARQKSDSPELMQGFMQDITKSLAIDCKLTLTDFQNTENRLPDIDTITGIDKNLQYHMLDDHLQDNTIIELFQGINYDTSNTDVKNIPEDYITKNEPLALGISKMITITPYYLKTSERKGENYRGAEKMQLDYTDIIQKNSTKIGLENHILNPLNFTSSDVDKFNDLAAMNEWFSERMEIDDVDMLPLSSDYVIRPAEKYGTTNLYFSAVINEIQRKDFGSMLSAGTLGAVLPPLAPFALYYILNPSHQTLMIHVIFDMRTGDIKLFDLDYFEEQMDASIFLDSQVYAKLVQIKNSDTKTKPE